MISTVKHKKNAMTEIRGKATKIYLTDKNKWPFPFLYLRAVQLLSASEIKMYSISVALNMAKECLGVSFAVRLMFPDKYCTINNIKPIVESNTVKMKHELGMRHKLETKWLDDMRKTCCHHIWS